MVSFSCPNCGKEYKFNSLPIPDAGADFKCSQCEKTCRIIKRKNTVFCIQGSFEDRENASTPEIYNSRQTGTEELSADEIESRLQGLEMDLPMDTELMIGIMKGPDQGLSYPIRKPLITVGKTGCDINLKDIEVSREHCRIEVYGKQFTILRDLNSTGGSFRNGDHVDLAILQPGDTVQIGKTHFTLIQTPKGS